ncbi:MAG: gliding motility-associated C-terminal domain-containing protein [Flavobacteriales bacterium]
MLLSLILLSPSSAQGVFPFTSGPIPLCDTTTFTANVNGIGYLIDPDYSYSGAYLDALLMNITTDHPQTLQVWLTSPYGTTLLLSAFNGAGGQNYTNTQFYRGAYNSITTGVAPFTGQFQPQGGSLNAFVGEIADGTWVITVVDTSCANGGTGPGGNWIPGWFDGSAGGGAFAFGFNSGSPNYYDYDLGSQSAMLCPGGSVDIMTYFANLPNGPGPVLTAYETWSGTLVTDPYAVTQAGDYSLDYFDGYNYYHGIFNVIDGAGLTLGPDQVVDQCAMSTPVALPGLFNLAGLNAAWSFNGQPITDAEASSVTTSGVYQLVAGSNAGCADTALVTVTMHPAPALGADQFVSICPGGTADLSGVYDTTGLLTMWTFAGAPVIDPSAIGSAGLYTLVATNANGCSDTAAVQVAVSPGPSLGPDQSLSRCAGETVDLHTLYSTGTGNTAWTLNGAAVASPNAVTAAGSYMLIVTTAAGCTDTATVNLQFNASPALGSDQTVTICAGESYDLGTAFNTAGLTAVWTLGTAPVNNPSAVLTSGNYQLVATNALNCSDMAMVNLWVNTPPSLGPDQLLNICPWQVVDLTTAFPVSGTSVTYTLDGQAVPDPTNVTEAGSYTIVSVDAIGCSDEAIATVVPVECLCVADFSEDAHCLQEPVRFTLHADSTVLAAHWDFHGTAQNINGQDPVVRFNEPGRMQVTLQATLSCGVVTVEHIVNVPDCSDSCALFIPSAYTPNGDGANDGWTWQGDCQPKDYSMTVFDRWGSVVFTSTDPYKAWDGTMNGKELPYGVYAYRVAYRLLYQDAKEQVGSITLIR